MSIEVNLKDLLQLPVCMGLSEGALETRFYKEYEFRQRVLKAYYLKKNLHNGTTMRIGCYTYRNENLYFWDAQNKEIVEPCILEFDSNSFSVHPGDPSWSETIVDEASSPRVSPSSALPTSDQPLDSVVTAVLDSFKQRAATGQKKYGTNLDRTDLKTLDWIQHMQEELMDATLYLEKLKREFSDITRPSQE